MDPVVSPTLRIRLNGNLFGPYSRETVVQIHTVTLALRPESSKLNSRCHLSAKLGEVS